MAARSSSDREVSRDYRLLFRLARFAKPYGWQIAGATLALIITAGTTLGLGVGLRVLVDQGFSAGDASLLDRAVLILFGVSVLLAAGTFARFYLVSWVGERVVADIRKAVFDHIIGLSP
ncbi:MAG TPA: ABC transporter transmembrane domain-containing protein, partial [Dongiaceae bacterium]|nr:ABC transporter transmembrane domain-containing protein [Dongiaceae bacterium]